MLFKTLRRPRVLALALAGAALVAVTATVALAFTTEVGKGPSWTKVVRETAPTTTSSTSWVNVPGAAGGPVIPVDDPAIILAQFTAETRCTGQSPTGGPTAWCAMRMVLVNVDTGATVEMEPASGGPAPGSLPDGFAMDSTDGGTEGDSSWEGHAFDRSIVVRIKGRYSIRVHYGVTNPALSFWVDDFHLTVQRIEL